MSISTIYRVSHTLPESLTRYLSADSLANTHFENALSEAQKQNVGAGSDSYSERNEWAEFTDHSTARKCDDSMRRIISTYHTRAISHA